MGAKISHYPACRGSVEAGHQDATVAQVNLAEFRIGPGLVTVVGEPCGFVPEVRRFVIGHPFLDRAFPRDDRLECLDVEGRLWRWRDVDDTRPKSPEAEEEFDMPRAAHAADGLHGRVAACAEGKRRSVTTFPLREKVAGFQHRRERFNGGERATVIDTPLPRMRSRHRGRMDRAVRDEEDLRFPG